MKQYSYLIRLCLLVGLLASCGKNQGEVQEVQTVIVSDSEDELQTQEGLTSEEVLGLLGSDELYNELYVNPTKEMEEQSYALDMGDIFVESSYDSLYVPQELILAAEETLYGVCRMEEFSYEPFEKMIEQFGGDELELSVDEICELIPAAYAHREEIETVYDACSYLAEPGSPGYTAVFRFYCDGKMYYLFRPEIKGSSGYCEVEIREYVNGEFVCLDHFGVPYEGGGSVITYQDEYYYIALQFNRNLTECDEIRIHKLGANVATENIRIRYIPSAYTWTTVYANEAYEAEAIESYISDIQDDFWGSGYIEDGTIYNDLINYVGDEVAVDDFSEELSERHEVYVVDFANIGMPIYVNKWIFEPSGVYKAAHINLTYYVESLDEIGFEAIEEIEYKPYLQHELIQLWFREIDGKIYTFELFYLGNYNYLLNVMLMEGDQVTQINKTILTPEWKFEFIEGTVFYP